MSTAPALRRGVRAFVALAVALLVAFAGILTAPVAHAAPTLPSTSALSWGFKSEWHAYVTRFGGTVTGAGGVVVTGTEYSWPAESVSYDATDGALDARFGGSVNWSVPSHTIDITVSAPRIVSTADGGAVHWTGPAGEILGASIESLSFGTVTEAEGISTVTVSATGIAFTAAGAAAFGSYGEGAALRDLSFTLQYETPEEPPAPAVPSITVSKSTGLISGETVTVTGSGFGVTDEGGPRGTRPPLAGKFSGVYVVFGTFLENWKPSAGAPSSARKVNSQKWVVNPDDVATIGAAQGVAINPDGTFSLELVVTENFEGALAAGNYGIYTYPGSGATYAPFETYTPISFGAVVPPVTPPVTPEPQPQPEPAPVIPAAEVTAGSMSWGIKQAFRNYVTGTIAKGSISVSGARAAGSNFVFGQSSSAGFDMSAGLGRVDYSGTVRFTGHGGELDLSFVNPSITVTSPTSGRLEVTVGGTRVVLATLALNSGIRSTVNGAIVYSGVPAALTAQGVAAFRNFYPAGSALDPITFSIGAPAASSGAAVTVASFQAARTPAATPPATSGISVENSEGGEIVSGGQVTITASGFQPNETGILVVLYSTPVVLDRNATADANGVVRWTGMLPAELSGQHTLTLQGSVNRGVELEIAPAMMTLASIGSCSIDGATLDWGFKESFRAYVSGTIARGSWSVADGATYETPTFSWSDGTGGVDPDLATGEVGFTGSITFTGHEGVLNTTVANPVVRFDGDAATLLVDVTGETRDGESVEAIGVEFAEFDLSGIEPVTEGDAMVLTAVPGVFTAAGADAFGTYPAGDAVDPITLSLPGVADCVDTAPVAADGADDEVTAAPIEAGPDLTWLVWLVGIVIVIGIAVLVVWVMRGRTRA